MAGAGQGAAERGSVVSQLCRAAGSSGFPAFDLHGPSVSLPAHL